MRSEAEVREVSSGRCSAESIDFTQTGSLQLCNRDLVQRVAVVLLLICVRPAPVCGGDFLWGLPNSNALCMMDSPAVTRIFQQLFTRPSRNCLRLACARRQARPPLQRRAYSLRRKEDEPGGGSTWQQRIDAFPQDMSKQLREYPRVTAQDLRHRTQRPRRVKMLTREFIDGMKTTYHAKNRV